MGKEQVVAPDPWSWWYNNFSCNENISKIYLCRYFLRAARVRRLPLHRTSFPLSDLVEFLCWSSPSFNATLQLDRGSHHFITLLFGLFVWWWDTLIYSRLSQ